MKRNHNFRILISFQSILGIFAPYYYFLFIRMRKPPLPLSRLANLIGKDSHRQNVYMVWKWRSSHMILFLFFRNRNKKSKTKTNWHTSSLDDLSWRGGVAGDAWLNKSGKTLLVRVFGAPLFSPRFYNLGKWKKK